MDKIEKEEEKKGERNLNISTPPFRSYLLTALIIIGVVFIGLLAINQFLDYQFKAQLLGSPCNFCEELNPHLERCFNEVSNIRVDPYAINITNIKW